MKVWATALAFGAVAGSAQADPLADLTWATFESICVKGSEQSLATRDLSEQAGLVRQAAPPPALIRMLPLGASTASYLAVADQGQIHVISTVVPPPATPFSCMVAVTDGDDDTWSRVEAGMASNTRYKTNGGTTNDTGGGLDYQFVEDGAINRVIGARVPSPQPGAPNMMFIAYRIEQ